ncbi:hypothetical protein AVEN_40066-1, partial [Araneus ventricosus]
TPPHVPVPVIITVAAPVGWTWDIYADRTPPHVAATITVAASVGWTWDIYTDRTPPHVATTITVAASVGWTWDTYADRTPPHVAATITVAAPVGWTSIRTERRPMSLPCNHYSCRICRKDMGHLYGQTDNLRFEGLGPNLT